MSLRRPCQWHVKRIVASAYASSLLTQGLAPWWSTKGMEYHQGCGMPIRSKQVSNRKNEWRTQKHDCMIPSDAELPPTMLTLTLARAVFLACSLTL